MTSATVVPGSTRQAVREASTPSPRPEKSSRAPSLRRPDGISDTEWAIMRQAKNEDVHKRVNAFLAGEADLNQEEASLLLEIVMGAERNALMTIVKLRKQLAPKIEEAATSAAALNDIRMRLFRAATGR